MSTLFEYQVSGDGYDVDEFPVGQTIIIHTAHIITSIKFKLWRKGSPSGNVVANLYEADANHLPTGSVLATAQISASSITTTSPGVLYEFVFGNKILLEQGEEYAITLDLPFTDADNAVECRYGASSYPGYRLIDFGNGWQANTDGYDLVFEEYGVLPTPAPTNVSEMPLADGQHIQVSAVYHSSGTVQGTYAHIQISDKSDFSNVLYDSGQYAINPIDDGATFNQIVEWVPSSQGIFYSRIAFWDDDTYTVQSPNWGSNSFTVGYPSILNLSKTQNKEHFTFTTQIKDTYTKPPVVSLVIDNQSWLMELKERTGSGPYTYTYQKTLALERGSHEYHVEVGNVWTVLIGDTNYLEAQYTLQNTPAIEVFSGNRGIDVSNAVLTENMIPDVDTLDFDTEEDLRSGIGTLTVRFTGNEIKGYTMHVSNIRKKAGGWHVRAEETAKDDLQQVTSFSSQAISSLSIVQSILPSYTIHGGDNLTETIYLQAFQNERIRDILQRILLINGAAATARNGHLYIYPQSGTSKAVLRASDPDTQYSADMHIINKLREYYVKKQYPVPGSALTNYDASNWGGTVSNVLQTSNGVLPKHPYCLKGTDTISRAVDFEFTDYDQMHIGFAPDVDNTLEIRLETDASNYRKYVRTFSGKKGAGFVLTGSSSNATVTKDITFGSGVTKYIHLVEGRASQSCSAKIELKKSGTVVAESEWQTVGDGYFGQYFNNVECDTITISFTNLCVVGTSYGVNCLSLHIEEHVQGWEASGTHTFAVWRNSYSGTSPADPQISGSGWVCPMPIDDAMLGSAYPLNSYDTLHTKASAYIRASGKNTKTGGTFILRHFPVSATIQTRGGKYYAVFDFCANNQGDYDINAVEPKVYYNATIWVERTIESSKTVWYYKQYDWSSTYNLFDYASIPLSSFTTVGSPTNQVNTIRLVATGDVYYDELYFVATNPSPEYVEAKNQDSIDNHWLSFQTRTTDGWSSKESAQAFAQAFVDKFGEPAESYEKNVSFWTDINLGDMAECDGKQLQVYCIVYNPGKGTKRIMVGRKITDTLEFLKQASAKIQALEKTIM